MRVTPVAIGEDDATIADTDWLYRRIPPSQMPYDGNRGRRWPSSAALLPSSGDTEVSAYLGSELEILGLTADDVLQEHEGFGLIRFPARAVRQVGLGVKRDPVRDAERPLVCDPAHAAITGTPMTSKAKRGPARKLLGSDLVEVLREPVGT